MSLTATKHVRIGTRNYRRGEIVEISAARARDLIKAGLLAGEVPEEDAKSDAADLSKLTNKQLQEIAAAEEIAVEANDNKATLVDKITAGRVAKA